MKKANLFIYKDNLHIVWNAFNTNAAIHIYAIAEKTNTNTYFCLFVMTDKGLKIIARNIKSDVFGMSRLYDAIEGAFSNEFSGAFIDYIYNNTTSLNQFFY